MENKKADALTSAGQNELRIESYQSHTNTASLKLLVGETLLLGNRQLKDFWQATEALLRVYIDFRLYPQSVPDEPENTNAEQPD